MKKLSILGIIIFLLIFSISVSANDNTQQYSNDKKLFIKLINNNKLVFGKKISKHKNLLTIFDKKTWGTWNINGWYIENNINEESNYYLLAGGGTDWEYVFRVAKNKNEFCSFGGGNHGNEILKDIKIYNGETNTLLYDNGKLLDENYENIKTSTIIIIEKTSLLFSNTNIEYANVKRTYTIYPESIILNTNFKFTENVYMLTSYICMFPVSKAYGMNFKFDDNDKIISTPKLGKTLTTKKYENYVGKLPSLNVNVSGTNSNISFKVWIDNLGMVNDFDNCLKTFVWDMNKYQNKVYFSKFDFEKRTLIKKDTEWVNKEGWNIHIE